MSFNQSGPWRTFSQQQMFVSQPQPQPQQYAGGQNWSQTNMGGAAQANLVQYPPQRLNQMAFAQQQQQQPQNYNSIGTVSKINTDCGLVNDEVFFYRNVCKGPEPKVGDRVLFEATYSPSGQFKWNATRVQLMPQQSHQPPPLMATGAVNLGGNKGNYNADYSRSAPVQRHISPRRDRSPPGIRHPRPERKERERNRRSREKDEEEQDRKRHRDDHDRERDRKEHRSRDKDEEEQDRKRRREDHDRIERDRKEREREREREKEREREREKDRSDRLHTARTNTARARAIRRYMVSVPKYLLPYKSADLQELRQRYSTLYIPSDFFHASIKWPQSFTPDNPFSLRRPCQFHIMHRIVEPPFEPTLDLLQPPDADYLYSAKVMLLSCPPIVELYQKCCEDDESDNEQNAVHPSRLISFLVGTRGRNEPMAIGGPWSPSLDGPNPDKDPLVLINTAIRCCKALTGIDLSKCTQWFRFVELYYHRTDYKNKEKDASPRIETVVIYLPDIHSCMPNSSDWQKLSNVYKGAVDNLLNRKSTTANNKPTSSKVVGNDNGNGDSKTQSIKDESTLDDKNSKNVAAGAGPGTGATAIVGDNAENANASINESETTTAAVADNGSSSASNGNPDAGDKSATSETISVPGVDGGDGDTNKNEKDNTLTPTHYSKLDLKSMKIVEIRNELTARNLLSKGSRNIIMARLAKAINTEKAEEELECKSKNQMIIQENDPDDVTEIVDDDDDDADNKVGDNTEKSKNDANVKGTVDDKTVAKVELQQKEDKTVNKDATNADATEGDGRKSLENNENDENDAWGHAMDVDMNDIVILDEYDASKNSDEMDEKEKQQLKRRYTLPSTPHIVVHPNKLAKGGKFDCSVMSLSVLLDYRPDDAKERFFEVSLFAELFNEMLMRDFGFNIYKELIFYKETKSSNDNASKDDKSTSIAEGDEKSNIAIEASNNQATNQQDNKSKDKTSDVKTNNDVSSEKSLRDRRGASKRSIDDVNEEDTQSIKSGAERKRRSTNGKEREKEKDRDRDHHEKDQTNKKIIVVKPHLLLSFVYFDTTHCGYIFDKDLEDLFSILGIALSRAQIRKVLAKISTRQSFYYRKLTDREESLEAPPAIEDIGDIPSDDLKKIALGNKQYDFLYEPGTKILQDSANGDKPTDAGTNENGLINYNGTLIHIGQLIEQVKRTEKNCSDLEKLYKDVSKHHSELVKENSKYTNKIKDLQAEVKSLNRKLSDADQDLYSLNRKHKDLHSTLAFIYNRVEPYFTREKEKEKNKEKENKLKDGKEKAKEKDVKEKDKDKDGKEKEKDGKEMEKESKEKEKEKDKDKEKNEKEIEKNGNEQDKAKEKEKESQEQEKESNDKIKDKESDINGQDNQKKDSKSTIVDEKTTPTATTTTEKAKPTNNTSKKSAVAASPATAAKSGKKAANNNPKTN